MTATDRRPLANSPKLFQDISPDSMAYLLSAWRGEVDLLDLGKPEYRRAEIAPRHRSDAVRQTTLTDPAIARAVATIKQTGIRKAS